MAERLQLQSEKRRDYKMEKCPIYAQEKAEKIPFPGVDSVICYLEECPYNNGQTLHWELDPVIICKTKGLLEKVLLVN